MNVNAGTVNPLPISIKRYRSMQIIGAKSGIKYNIRTGNKNDSNTDMSTATIIQSGNGSIVELALSDCNPYIVVGDKLDYPSDVKPNNNISDLNVSFSHTITEIYLV